MMMFLGNLLLLIIKSNIDRNCKLNKLVQQNVYLLILIVFASMRKKNERKEHHKNIMLNLAARGINPAHARLERSKGKDGKLRSPPRQMH
ncbi:hypothetical protein, partial [Acinetobacter baumannii]|uniref:hypothetical protein n=1 Tax=Acinetobacter baumannii TaxID=470 RepID=UPI001C07E307